MRVTAWVATWHAAFIDVDTVGSIVGIEAGDTVTGVTAVGIVTNRIGATNVGGAFVDIQADLGVSVSTIVIPVAVLTGAFIAAIEVGAYRVVSAQVQVTLVDISAFVLGVAFVSGLTFFAVVGTRFVVAFLVDVAFKASQGAFVIVDTNEAVAGKSAVTCAEEASSNIFTGTVDITRAVVAFVDVGTFNAAAGVTRVAFA
jgi:hypothetical protein